MIQISNIKVALSEEKEQVIQKTIEKLIGKKREYKIIRESVDARRGIFFVYTIQLDAAKNEIKRNTKIQYTEVKQEKIPEITKGDLPLQHRPVVIGFGPAGIFCAYELAKNGYRPIVFEQGHDVDTRTFEVKKFWEKGILNPSSNVQFGEGGAGAFSDGKLTTRIKDPLAKQVIQTLYEFGGPEEITYANKPHIGTDILVDVVKNIRKEIIRLGG